MEKNPLVFPNGADVEYSGQLNSCPYGFPSSETTGKMYEDSYATFHSNPVSHNIMNEFLDGIRRNDSYMWINGNVSRYSSSTNPIANEVSSLYKRDDNRYEEWQYITLYRKFKRILAERGRCSNEMISYLICNLINIIKNDTALRNLLILSSEEFLESLLTKFVDLILSDKTYNYEFSKPNEDDNKIEAMKKHLQRATKDASMSHSTSNLWGWNFQDHGFSFPNPIPPSKYNSDTFYARQLRPNPLLEGDCRMQIPRLMYPHQAFHFNPHAPMQDPCPTPETGPVKKKEPSKRYGPRGPYKRTLVRMRMREISKKRAVIRRLKSQSANTEPENSKDDLKEKVEDDRKNDIELCTTTPESELSDYNKENDYRELNLNVSDYFARRASSNTSDFANTSNFVNTYDYVNNNKNINTPENVNNLEKKPDIKNFKDLSFDNFKDHLDVGKDLPNKVDIDYRSNLETYNDYNGRGVSTFNDNYENSYSNPGYIYQDQMNAVTNKPYNNTFYRSLNSQFNQPAQFNQSNQYNQANRYSESTQFGDSSGYFDGYLQNQFHQLDSEVTEISAQNNPMIASGNYEYIRPNQFNQYSIGYQYPVNQPKSISDPSNPISSNISNTVHSPMNNISNVNDGVHFPSPNILGMHGGIGMGKDQAEYGVYSRDDFLSQELNTLETEAPILKTNRVSNPKHSKPLPDDLSDFRRRSTRLNPQINMSNVNNIKNNENMRNINKLNGNMENIKNINSNIKDNLNGVNNSLNGNLNIDGLNSNNSNSTENLNNVDGVNNNLNNMKNNCVNNDANENNDTIWDMVQKHQKSSSNVNINQTKTVNVVPKEIELEDEDMNLLIREPVRITEDMPQNHTQPFINAYKNPKTVKWSYTDTKRFYNAIETFGTDLMLVRAFLPEYTDRQIYDKFKLEERKNPQLMQNALQTHKSISLKQYEQKYGKIDTETHYNPDKDPFILEQPTDNKKSLQLNLSNASVINQIPQAPNDKIINLFM